VTAAGGAPGRAGGTGALADTLAIVTGVIDRSQRLAGQAGGVSERLGSDADRLLEALGGGPPQRVRDSQALVQATAAECDRAAKALGAAADSLRAFARRNG
jgi:hypothetical protein